MAVDKIPASLINALKNRKLVPFVGAGLSMSVNNKNTGKSLFPSWKQLLLNAAEKIEQEKGEGQGDLIKALLNKNRENAYLNAATEAKEDLGTHQWHSFLKQQLNIDHNLCDEKSLAAAKAVWQLGSPFIITTNYDKVLNWSCPEKWRNNLTSWVIQAPHEQREALAAGVTEPTIWHLHGHIGNVDKLILTPDGYQTLYGDDTNESQYQAALITLRTYLTINTMLFIGFSFDDQDFAQQLKYINKVFEGNIGNHYILIKKDQEQKIKDLGLPLQPITYDNHDDLPQLLEQLANFVDAPEAAQSTSKIDTTSESELTTTKYSLDNPAFTVPFKAKGEGVIGREDALKALRQQLLNDSRTSIGNTAALKGMGGLGKTQLAVEYAHTYRNEYPNGVIWLTADQEISSQLIHAAEKSKWISSHSKRELILNTAIKRVKTYSDCLIIFDNVDTQKHREKIKKYFPEVDAHPHLLITSRIEQPGFTAIKLDLLTDEHSLALLFKEAMRDQNSQTDEELIAAKTIVSELDRLPLAIEIAGAYLKHIETMPMVRYQQLLEHNLKKAMSGTFFSGFTAHEKDLYLTLDISDEQVSQAPLLKEVLLLLSWSAPAPMGLSLMTQLLEVDEYELYEPLELGVSLKLLKTNEDNTRYSIHRLLREVQRETRPITENTQWGIRVGEQMVSWFKTRKNNFANLAEFESEQDHLESWAELAEQNIWPQCSALIWLQSYPAWHWGKYQESETILQQAQSIQENDQFETPELMGAEILCDLGHIKSKQGKYQVALELGQQAFAIRLEQLGEHHPDVALSYNNIGTSYGELGNHNKELEYQQKALFISLEQLGENHPNVARSYNNVGSSYDELGNHDKALEYKQKALAIWLGQLGENHPDVALSYNNIGGSYRKSGNHNKALEYQQKALTIWLKQLGAAHPDSLNSLKGIVVSYINLKRFKEASNEVYQFEKLLPSNNPHKSKLSSLNAYINQESTKAGFGATKSAKSSPRKKRLKKNRKN